jgi:hypothetical protein
MSSKFDQNVSFFRLPSSPIGLILLELRRLLPDCIPYWHPLNVDYTTMEFSGSDIFSFPTHYWPPSRRLTHRRVPSGICIP